jgi:hypothetical protein
VSRGPIRTLTKGRDVLVVWDRRQDKEVGDKMGVRSEETVKKKRWEPVEIESIICQVTFRLLCAKLHVPRISLVRKLETDGYQCLDRVSEQDQQDMDYHSKRPVGFHFTLPGSSRCQL